MGVARGLIEEANPLLAWVMENPSRLPVVVVIVGVGMAIKFVAHHGKGWVVWPLIVALGSRVAVLWMHLKWVGGLR